MPWTEPVNEPATPDGAISAARHNAQVLDNLRHLHATTALQLTNQAAATMDIGTVAVRTAGGATLTTTVGDTRPVVVATQTIAAGAPGWYQAAGIASVQVVGAVAVGDRLQTSATAGVAQVGDQGAFAVALEANNASGVKLVRARLGSGAGGGGGPIIADEGTALPQRTRLDFVGAGVTVTDDAANDRTVVSIPGGGGGGGTTIYLGTNFERPVLDDFPVQVNIAAGVASDSPTGIVLERPDGVTESVLRGVFRGLPAPPWDVYAYVQAAINSPRTFFQVGLAMRNTSDGSLRTFVLGTPTDGGLCRLEYDRWTNENTPVGTTPPTDEVFLDGLQAWLRIADDGTNRRFYYSLDDGQHWTIVRQETSSSWVPQQIGFAITKRGTSRAVVGILRHFSFTPPAAPSTGAVVPLDAGGTGANLSATGPGVVKQAATGAALSVAPLALGDLPVAPLARLYLASSGATLETGTWTTLSWAGAVQDTGGLFSSSAPDRLQAQVGGTYLWGAVLKYEVNSTGIRGVSLMLNGTTTIVDMLLPAQSGGYTRVLAVGLMPLSSGDYVICRAYQDSGDDLQVLGDDHSAFWCVRLSG